MAFTFEEWKKGYNDNRPVEPCCASEMPEQWAEIADYAEDKLKEAFDAGYQSCRKEYGRHFLKDGNKGKKEPFPKIDMTEFLISPKGQILKDTEENRTQLLKIRKGCNYENKRKRRDYPLAGQ